MSARTSTDIIIAGRQAVTHEFWDYERHKYDLYVSVYVHNECSRGDPELAGRRVFLLKDIEILTTTPDVEPLADVYMGLLSMPSRNKAYALHIAICCVNDIDILLSWNFAHLGTESMQIIQKYNDARGISTPRMITPDAVVCKYMEVELND